VRAFDRTGFFIHQTTKVGIRKFLDKGIEVYTYSKDGKLGFIPYCNLVTNIDNLYEGKSLYVHFLGYKKPHLFFTEEGTVLFPDLP